MSDVSIIKDDNPVQIIKGDSPVQVEAWGGQGSTGEKGDPGSPSGGVPTRAQLATAGNSATVYDDIYLSAPGHEGRFIYDAGNVSAEITALGSYASSQTFLVPRASTTSGALGAYRRAAVVLEKEFKIQWLTGVSAPADTDTHIPLQFAHDYLRNNGGGGKIKLPPYPLKVGGGIPNAIGNAALRIFDNITIEGHRGSSEINFVATTEDVSCFGVLGSDVNIRDFKMTGMRNTAAADRPFLLYIGSRNRAGATALSEVERVNVEDMILADTDTAVRVHYSGRSGVWTEPRHVSFKRMQFLNIGYQAFVPEGDDISLEDFVITMDPARPLRSQLMPIRVIGARRASIRNGTIYGRDDAPGFEVQTAGVLSDTGEQTQYRDSEDIDFEEVHILGASPEGMARVHECAKRFTFRGGSLRRPLTATGRVKGFAWYPVASAMLQGTHTVEGVKMFGVTEMAHIQNHVQHVRFLDNYCIGNARNSGSNASMILIERTGGTDALGNALRTAYLVEAHRNTLIGHSGAYQNVIGITAPTSGTVVKAWGNTGPATVPFFQRMVGPGDGLVFNDPSDSTGTATASSDVSIGANSQWPDNSLHATLLGNAIPNPRLTQWGV